DAECAGHVDLARRRSERLLDPRRAIEKVAPASRYERDALAVLRERPPHLVDAHAALHDVIEVEIDVAEAEPREDVERRSDRLVLVRRRRRYDLERRHQSGSNSRLLT